MNIQTTPEYDNIPSELNNIIKIVAEDKDKTIKQLIIERDSNKKAFDTLQTLYSNEITKNKQLKQELEEYRSIAENIGAVKAVSEKQKAIQERDKALEILREIAEANNFDNIGNWARNKARKTLTEYTSTPVDIEYDTTNSKEPKGNLKINCPNIPTII